MKFRVHVFREYRETYEVEADNHDEALNSVDEHINDLDPVQTEMQDYLPHSLVDPILAGGVVDYENSRWFE